jgi:hypothetical protein
MIKSSLVLTIASLTLICVPAQAQERPTASRGKPVTEVFIGVGGHRGFEQGKSDWGSNFRFGIDMNLSHRIALVFAPSLGVGTTSDQSWVDYAILAGPRLRFRTEKRVMPFAQILAGVGRGPVSSNGPVSSPPDHATAFMISFAGGVDVGLTPRFAWRAIQFEERNQFGDVSGNHYVAASTGIVIRFGSRK